MTSSTTVPGSAGLPLISDKSYDFYKDPIKFQLRNLESTKSRVFLSRFLNKPTIFIGSNQVLRDTLLSKFLYTNKHYSQHVQGTNIPLILLPWRMIWRQDKLTFLKPVMHFLVFNHAQWYAVWVAIVKIFLPWFRIIHVDIAFDYISKTLLAISQ